MSEPEVLPPPSPEVVPPPRPFQPEKARAPYGPGCAKPLALGCGLFLLLGIVGLVVVVVQRFELMAWSLEAMRPEIERRLADDATEEEKARVVSAVAAAAARARSGKMDAPAMQALQGRLLSLSAKPKLTATELDEFLDALEAFAAEDGADPDPTP